MRHELGHILADIGEEYDGGTDYSGPNFAETARLCEPGELPRRVPTYDGVRDVWPCMSWRAWLPKQSNVVAGATSSARIGSNRRKGSRSSSNGSAWVQPPPGSMPLAAWPFVSLSANSKPAFSLSLNSARVVPELRGTRILISVAGIRTATAQAVSEELPALSASSIDTSASSDRFSNQSVSLPPEGYGVDAFGQVARFEVTLGGTTLIIPPAPSLDRTFYSFAMPPLRSGLPAEAGLQLRGTTQSSAHNSDDQPISLAVTLARPPGHQEARRVSADILTPATSEDGSGSGDGSTAGLPLPMLCHVQVHQYPAAQDAARAAERPKTSAASISNGLNIRKTSIPSPLVALTKVIDTAALGNEAVGAFPVFGARGELKGYRPTQEGCLMRDMRQTCFCAVCLERLWRKVLPRTGLFRSHHADFGTLRHTAIEKGKEAANGTLHSFMTGPIAVDIAPDATAATLSVRLAPLGDFAEPHSDGIDNTESDRKEDEFLEVRWHHVPLTYSSSSQSGKDSGIEHSVDVSEEESISYASIGFQRHLEVPLPLPLIANERGSLVVKCWRARAHFVTSRVRSEPRVFEEKVFALFVTTTTTTTTGSSTSHAHIDIGDDGFKSSPDHSPWTVITSRWQVLPENNVVQDLDALVNACAGVYHEAEPTGNTLVQKTGSRQIRWLTSAEAGLDLPSLSRDVEGAFSSRSMYSTLILSAEVFVTLLALSYVCSLQRRRSFKEV